MTQATTTPFTLSLTLTAHHHAQTFRQYHGHPSKAKQVYLNTLAVYAVYDYLSGLGLDPDLAASPSWDPLQQMLLDTATLQVTPTCTLECRPVLPGATHLTWPPETPDHSQGIIAVALDASLRQADILGFVPSTAQGSIALLQIHPIEALGVHLSTAMAAASSVPQHHPTPLHEWWTGVTDGVWQTLDSAAALFTATPNYAFRNTIEDAPQTEAPIVSRIKRCQLGQAPTTLAVDLLVGLQQVSPQEIDVYVQIKAAEPHLRLPKDLEMAVLDETGTQVMQAQSLGTEALQMKFSTAPTEAFQLRLTLNDDSLTEAFVA